MMAYPKPFLLLLLLLQLQLVAVNSLLLSASTFTNDTTALPECLPGQASALLRLKRSFSASHHSSMAFRSWKAGTDCCRWEGIGCRGSTGHVTSLDLGDCGLESLRLDPGVFELTSLRKLSLGGNDFHMSEIPSAGFEQLTMLTHLNLSTSNFSGQVPQSIGDLTNLVSLDLSFRFEFSELLGYGYRVRVDSSYPGQLLLSNITTLVANLGCLRELHLSFVDLSSEGEEWCTALARYTPNLRVLSMPYCKLSSPICGSFSRLHSIRVIDLPHNHLTGPFPLFFADFSSLIVLQLSYNDIGGWVPPAIFQHKKIVTIDFHYNFRISGHLPKFPADSNIENLLVGNTNFSGAIPSSISNLKSLKMLGLGSHGFAGKLPSTIGRLRTLVSLQVSGLRLIGLLPSWITNLTSLDVLEISHCRLYGPIPSSIGGLIKLRKLALYNCNFSGKIPPHILNATQLETLQLHSNNFIGTVHLASFSKLARLVELDLSNNKLILIDGEYNSSLASFFPNIMYLRLASCNISKFPNVLRYLHWIEGLDLSNNQIHGAIPQWAWEQWTGLDLFFLNLSHNKFNNVGYETFLPFHVHALDLSFNMLEGQIPIPQNSGDILDYSNNHFSSMPPNISTQLGQTALFKASRNLLSGKITPAFCGTKLQIIDLSYNNLNGSIPSCLLEDAYTLKVLNLKENQLHGKLPRKINGSCALEALDFSGNQIEGDLPRSLAYCKHLEVLDVGNNQISDSFPCWMAVVPRLQVLVIKLNKFFGPVAPSVRSGNSTCEFPSLRILDLSSNNFSGRLMNELFVEFKSMVVTDANETSVMEYEFGAQQVYRFATILTYKGSAIMFTKILTTLVFIDVSDNTFHGSIPKGIGQLVLLHGLNLSHNFLTGAIPSHIGHLSQLEVFDLSSNELSGVIPDGIASLDFLTVLNLSYNSLEGRIPESPHFLTFSDRSFMGNNFLCGPPLSRKCSGATPPNGALHTPKENSVDIILFLFVGLGFGVGFADVIMFMGTSH